MSKTFKKSQQTVTSFLDYDSLLAENKTKTNGYLNVALWLCALTGPALALGVFFGVFKDVSYSTCILLSLFVIILAFSHFILVRRFPESDLTSVYSLFVLDLLLAYMAISNVYLRLTWFLVPVLSLLFCSYRVYFVSVTINYIVMVVITWITAPYYALHRADFLTAPEYFGNVVWGYTIETLIMTIAGLSIVRTFHRYSKEIYNNYTTLKNREGMLQSSVDTLASMAGIYDKVNLLDFRSMTEMPITDNAHLMKTLNIDKCDHTSMVMNIKDQIAPEQLDNFLSFTDLKTLRERLLDKKSIYGEFINISTGWFRAQYITVETNEDGIPVKVIFTVQNIERDKRKEAQLIRIAMTDELTHLFNRRSYDDDIMLYRDTGLDDTFTLLSADVNGLKNTNDTKGHAAGDELIKGAADCLSEAIGDLGKVYRTGGDEFIAILHIDDYREICEVIKSKSSIWKGEYSDSLSISIGCASHNEFPDATIDELERISDRRMYEAKDNYYLQSGIDRRKRRQKPTN